MLLASNTRVSSVVYPALRFGAMYPEDVRSYVR